MKIKYLIPLLLFAACIAMPAADTKPWELYNLANNRSETKKLVKQYPEKAGEMEQAWLQHARELHALAEQDPPPGGFIEKRGKAKK